MNDNLTIKNLLDKLKGKNKKEDGGLLEQILSPPTSITESKMPSLKQGQYLLMPACLEARFQYAGRWVNATASYTWLSTGDMETAWNNSEILKQLSLRKDDWPNCVLNQYAPEKLVLFGMDIDQGNEIYLIFKDAPEPQVVSYFEYQETNMIAFWRI